MPCSRVARSLARRDNPGLLLDRACLREIALRLLFVTTGVVFLTGLGGAIRASAISQGAPLWVALALVPLIVGQALPYFLPLALLTAVVLTYGRTSADGEDVAAFAAGARPARLLLPAAIAGLVVALITLLLNAELLPDMYRRMRELAARVQVAALENTNPSRSELHYGGLNLMWNGRDEDGSFREVLLQIRSGPDNRPDAAAHAGAGPPPEDELRIRADRARMRTDGGSLIFAFEGMRAFSETGGERGWNVQNDGWTSVKIDLGALSDAQAPEPRAKDLPSRTLLAMQAAGTAPGDDPERLVYTLHQRRALAFAAVPLALLGALLGWRLRRGGMLAGFSAAASLLILLFYPAYYLGEGLFDGGFMAAVPAAWVPVAALLPPLAWLLRGAARRA